jgi:hypothetical protein
MKSEAGYQLRRRFAQFWSFVGIFIISSCQEQPLERTKDWWKKASDRQIIQTVFRSYCVPDPSTCLARSSYRVELLRDTSTDFLSVVFENGTPVKTVSISCVNYRSAPAIHCHGSWRRGGTNSGNRYPILWESDIYEYQ